MRIRKRVYGFYTYADIPYYIVLLDTGTYAAYYSPDEQGWIEDDSILFDIFGDTEGYLKQYTFPAWIEMLRINGFPMPETYMSLGGPARIVIKGLLESSRDKLTAEEYLSIVRLPQIVYPQGPLLD